MITGALFILIVLIVALWIVWQLWRDPLDFIDRPPADISVARDSLFYDALIPVPRAYHKLVFSDPEIGEMNCVLSLPDSIGPDPIPALIILGGLEIGVETLKYIPDPGHNAIIIYQYPYHPEYWYYGSAVTEIPVIRKSVLSVPAQVLALYDWAGRQAWTDTGRISLAGYSFGALFIPAIVHLSQRHGHHISHSVISYGGADLYHLLEYNMTNIDPPWRRLISWLAITAIRGIEPAEHAPHIKSDVLLINGTEDHQIPESCWRLLHRLVPEPKSVILLQEGHMDPRKRELTMKLVRLTKQWLVQKDVINN